MAFYVSVFNDEPCPECYFQGLVDKRPAHNHRCIDCILKDRPPIHLMTFNEWRQMTYRVDFAKCETFEELVETLEANLRWFGAPNGMRLVDVKVPSGFVHYIPKNLYKALFPLEHPTENMVPVTVEHGGLHTISTRAYASCVSPNASN